MNKNIALLVASIVFGLVAIGHLLRLLFHLDVIIAGFDIPMWFSVLGLIVAAILSIWMFLARRS